MRFNQYFRQCFCLTLSVLLFTSFFLAGCGGKVPSTLKLLGIKEIKPCTLGLKLEPGESCRYVDSNEDFSFDFIFYVPARRFGHGAGFHAGTVKTPSGTYPIGGVAMSGGVISNRLSNDLIVTINKTGAQICVGQVTVQDYRDFDLAVTQKCFSASRNSDGSWTVNRLPLPAGSK